MEIIIFKRKKWKEKIEDKHAKDKKNIVKLGTIVFIQRNIEVPPIAYEI